MLTSASQDGGNCHGAARGVSADRAAAAVVKLGAGRGVLARAAANWSTFSVIERLERDLGKPVLTTNQVSLWHALKILGAAPLSGLGALLREHLDDATVVQR